MHESGAQAILPESVKAIEDYLESHDAYARLADNVHATRHVMPMKDDADDDDDDDDDDV